MNRLARPLWLLLLAPLACAERGLGDPEAPSRPGNTVTAALTSETALRVFRPNTGAVHTLDLRTGATSTFDFRGTGVPLRMTRWGGTMTGLYHRSQRTFYFWDGSKVVFGRPGDLPVVADYDGDGNDDFAVWTPSDGMWLIKRSRDGRTINLPFGANGDVPVPGDYDGDGQADIAYYNPPSGNWYVIRSSDGAGTHLGLLGGPGHKVAQADYDGDRKTDLAVYVPWEGEWWVSRSSDGVTDRMIWGGSADIPVPADYDGDGKADRTVWNPSNGFWHIMMSSVGYGTKFQHIAGPGDIPFGFRSLEPTWLVDGAVPSVPPPDRPDGGVNPPPPPPPPPPMPTHGQVFARMFLDTSGSAANCGSTVFTVDGTQKQQLQVKGNPTAEGVKPGLARCRYEAMFWKVDPGTRTVCAGRFPCKSISVTAGQTSNVRFE